MEKAKKKQPKKSKTKTQKLDREERNKCVEEKRGQSRTRERQSCTYTMSFYLAEYDVDYTADHHQSVEDVPGVPDITLNMAACTASGRRGEGRGQEERNRGVRSTEGR